MFRQWIKPHALLSMLVLATQAQAETRPSKSLLTKAGWAQIQVVGGRLCLAGVRQNHNEHISCSDAESGVCESLSISSNTDSVGLRYQWTDSRQNLTVEFAGTEVTVSRYPVNGAEIVPLRLIQRERYVSVTLTESRRSTEYRAKSIWHLLLGQRHAGTQLIAVLEQVQPEWELEKTIGLVEHALVRTAEIDLPLQKEHCEALIEQLASPRFQQRRAAARQLRTLGPSAWAQINQLDVDELDAEQALHIASITQCLKSPYGDGPQLAAAQLLDDGPVWLSLLAHVDPPVRRIARQQLVRIYQRPIELDLQADRATLDRQITQLASEIGR